MRYRLGQPGFTLIELLVVISIVALLVGLLLPALSNGRRAAMIVRAHADLRSIMQSLETYRLDNDDGLPPTRFSCSTRSAYELPIELITYLPGKKDGLIEAIHMPDVFSDDGSSYLFRAVGNAIVNEYTLLQNQATLWVPDGFPYDEQDTGRYYSDPECSPVRYAVWSPGPDPDAALFDIPGRLPVPQAYWLKGSASGAGVVVHIEDSDRQVIISP